MQAIWWIGGIWLGSSLLLFVVLVLGALIRSIRGEKWEPLT